MKKWMFFLLVLSLQGVGQAELVEISMRDGSLLRGELTKIKAGKDKFLIFRVVGGKMKYDAKKIVKNFRKVVRKTKGVYILVFKTGKEQKASMEPGDAKLVVEVDKTPKEILLKDVYCIEVLSFEPGCYITVDQTELKKEPLGVTIGYLKKGATFEKLERQGKWTKVVIEGWVWTPATQE